jgi:hypothetical protein
MKAILAVLLLLSSLALVEGRFPRHKRVKISHERSSESSSGSLESSSGSLKSSESSPSDEEDEPVTCPCFTASDAPSGQYSCGANPLKSSFATLNNSEAIVSGCSGTGCPGAAEGSLSCTFMSQSENVNLVISPEQDTACRSEITEICTR